MLERVRPSRLCEVVEWAGSDAAGWWLVSLSGAYLAAHVAAYLSR